MRDILAGLRGIASVVAKQNLAPLLSFQSTLLSLLSVDYFTLSGCVTWT